MKVSLWKKVLFVLVMVNLSVFARYYSEDGQDSFVHQRYLKHIKNGFYVDIGAHEGRVKSNTYFFEKLGWEGVCFEPDPRNFSKLEKNRACILYNCAVGSKSGVEKFIQHPCSWVSGLDRTYCDEHREFWNVPKGVGDKYFIDVTVVTFNDIMEEIGVTTIDFLSIDTEGAEKDILTSIDYDKYYIRTMAIENKYHDASIPKFLKSKGFTRIQRLHRDEIYANQKVL